MIGALRRFAHKASSSPVLVAIEPVNVRLRTMALAKLFETERVAVP